MSAIKTPPTEAETPEVVLPKQEKAFLDYLEDEIKKLEERENRLGHLRSIRDAMTGQAPAKPATNGTATARKPRGKDRLGEFIAVINKHPEGITIPDVGKEIPDVAPNYLYRLKVRALAGGTVHMNGSLVVPGPADTTPAPA